MLLVGAVSAKWVVPLLEFVILTVLIGVDCTNAILPVMVPLSVVTVILNGLINLAEGYYNVYAVLVSVCGLNLRTWLGLMTDSLGILPIRLPCCNRLRRVWLLLPKFNITDLAW